MTMAFNNVNLRSRLLLGLVMLAGSGCTKTFAIRPVPPPQNVYAPTSKAEPASLGISDGRSASARPLNAGTLNVELEGMGDEMSYLGENLARVLNAEGIKVSYDKTGNADIKLTVRTYRIRNLRTSGFSPYHTFTTFSADSTAGGASRRITAYFKNSKVPVWAFREVERPCYQIPVEVIVKEIAAKVNAQVFGRVTPTETVNALAAAIPSSESDAASEQYLKVLELGYTNNPAAIEPLVRLTNRPETLMRVAAISALGMLRATDQFPLLRKTYETSENITKSMALKSIGDLDTPEAAEFVRSVKQSKDYDDDTIREVVDLYQ
ncbi:MAG TPA: HEAT repeat domain-containing protein [Candidatus Kryptonia bacterium]|nr:HEAT repeat domain-containing protein [Candidatus Kryptonia bacterium]